MVLYGERVKPEDKQAAREAIAAADFLLVGGTSLKVQPAAGLVHNFQGKHFAIINRDPTNYDRRAELVIRGNIGEVLSQIEVR